VLTLSEQAATPATPPAGQVLVYAKTDHNLYMLNSTGVETRVAPALWGSP
jgi:hypothetical protein